MRSASRPLDLSEPLVSLAAGQSSNPQIQLDIGIRDRDHIDACLAGRQKSCCRPSLSSQFARMPLSGQCSPFLRSMELIFHRPTHGKFPRPTVLRTLDHARCTRSYRSVRTVCSRTHSLLLAQT